jgi:hypothetical protein
MRAGQPLAVGRSGANSLGAPLNQRICRCHAIKGPDCGKRCSNDTNYTHLLFRNAERLLFKG